MKMFLVIALLVCNDVYAQSLAKLPDSLRNPRKEKSGVKKVPANPTPATQIPVEQAQTNQDPAVPVAVIPESDDQVKEKLVRLALQNADMTAADANIRIAEISRKKANSSMLGSVNVGANANEFVINNSPAANFFPKYNIGVSVPLDMFARNKAEKKTADQMIIINKSEKKVIEKDIRTKVLVAYEVYKEKKELVQLQKIAMEDDETAYQNAQKDFTDEVITLEQLNKVYKASINEKSILRTKEKDLNIAIIQLEELIGMPLNEALQK